MNRMPSSVSSAAAPGKDAANHSTELPDLTRRRATSKVRASAPPARGLRGQRQFRIRIRRLGLGRGSSFRLALLLGIEQLASPMLVVTQDSEPVEDRSRVPEDIPSRREADCTLELVVEID